MGRGKIVIKKIENPTNRQVTYSKRRTGIMKKAKELTVLCDAQVSIIMFSSTGKFSKYCSPSIDTKKMYDRYQQVTGIDLWSAQYEKMQNYLNHLKEINRNLRREIRQRMGEGLESMDIKDLRGLEQNLDEALKTVRERKYHLISTQTDTYKKKLKSAHEAHRHLLQELEIKDEQAAAYGGFVDDDDDGAVVLANGGGSHVYAIRVQPNQPNLQGIAYGFYDLRLA
ncbi:MADS-box transcription factor 16-like [Canna indica]|uniref:MADS-box transcription factor 16-like n=1 Tax=Canna indica TaxID=4628 RepID=A0AAQ3Q3Z4_9LILI|nr:MADS-box transcription factor 16-like [Canna indica]